MADRFTTPILTPSPVFEIYRGSFRTRQSHKKAPCSTQLRLLPLPGLLAAPTGRVDRAPSTASLLWKIKTNKSDELSLHLQDGPCMAWQPSSSSQSQPLLPRSFYMSHLSEYKRGQGGPAGLASVILPLSGYSCKLSMTPEAKSQQHKAETIPPPLKRNRQQDRSH